MNSEKCFLFFIRAYNDIDHLTPIMYKLKSDNPNFVIKAIVIDLENKYIEDFRIVFLIQRGISILHITDLISSSRIQIEIYSIILTIRKKLSKNNPLRKIINFIMFRFMKDLFKKQLQKLSVEVFLTKLLEGNQGVLVFDQSYVAFYERLISYCLQNKITTVAVPHGHNTFDNELIWTTSMDVNFNSSTMQRPFHFQRVVFENFIVSERYINLNIVTRSQVTVLGSTRFSDEWMKKIREILPPVVLPNLDRKILRIVFMMSKPKYNGNSEEVERTIKYLSNFPDVFIMIKPHTRGMKFKTQFGENVVIVDNEFHSPCLIDWADLVLFTMTSVIFDCLKSDKPALYLKNTHSNRLLSERYFHSWEVHCRDDLRKFIWALKENRKARTYSVEERDLYCKEVIDPIGKDVLEYYSSFLANL